MGKKIQSSHGSKLIWVLYLTGAAAGSIAMNYCIPYHSIAIPQVGADPAISSFFGFLTASNPRATAFTVVIPVKFWILLIFGVFLMTVSDSSCRNLGGLAMGISLGLLRRPFLV